MAGTDTSRVCRCRTTRSRYHWRSLLSSFSLVAVRKTHLGADKATRLMKALGKQRTSAYPVQASQRVRGVGRAPVKLKNKTLGHLCVGQAARTAPPTQAHLTESTNHMLQCKKTSRHSVGRAHTSSKRA